MSISIFILLAVAVITCEALGAAVFAKWDVDVNGGVHGWKSK